LPFHVSQRHTLGWQSGGGCALFCYVIALQDLKARHRIAREDQDSPHHIFELSDISRPVVLLQVPEKLVGKTHGALRRRIFSYEMFDQIGNILAAFAERG
jgi:hypothetical protein